MIKKLLTILLLLLIFNPTTIWADEAEPEAASETINTLPVRPGERNCPNDIDCDGVPDTNDNCPTIFNPYQTRNSNHPTLGDACNPEYQRNFRQNFREILDGTIPPTSYLPIANDYFGSCILDVNSINTNINFTCNSNNNIEKFRLLDQANRNRLIVSVLEEPISTENVFNRAQVCNTKYLRDINGGLQFTDGNPNQGLELSFDSPTIDSELQGIIEEYRTNLNRRKVAIAIDSCKTAYVERCLPQFTNIREVEFGNPLPQIITCSQVQLIFAESGVDLIKQYVGLIYRWAVGIAGVISVLVIMFNGIAISVAQGDDGKVSEAKGRIIQSLSALALLFLAGILLYTINPNFFTSQDLQFQPTVENFQVQENQSETTPPTE